MNGVERRLRESLCMTHVSIFLFLTCAYDCFPFPENFPTKVVRDDRMLDAMGSGKYSYKVELSDGTQLEQEGDLIPMKATNGGNSNRSLVVSGKYAFVDPTTGLKHEVKYTADKTGYHPHVLSPQNDNTTKLLNDAAFNNSTNENEKPLETISASLFSSPSESF
ncbi:unnamed protein product [Orchesella dallaii]|uniref:Uncharacterized protein n=1 Tax=Orchesella dallaii TaxID=48710 RepID=A0ABP1Q6Y5_9HEXA